MKTQIVRGVIAACALLAVVSGCRKITDPPGTTGPEEAAAEAVIFSFELTAPASVKGLRGDVDAHTKRITLSLPESTDFSAVRGTFTLSPGASIAPNSETAELPYKDGPVTFAVTAEDGTTVVNWHVAVSVYSTTSKSITAFRLGDIYTGVVNDETGAIVVKVPYNADVSAMGALVTHTGASIYPDPAVPRDYSQGADFLVKAHDGSEKKYVVTITRDDAPPKKITGFSIDGRVGAIDQGAKTILVTLAYGTTPALHTPDVQIEGASYRPSGELDFSASATTPVSYFVKDVDGGELAYAVTVVAGENDANRITAFSVGNTGDGALDAVLALMPPPVIDDQNETVTVTLPRGMDKRFTPGIAHEGDVLDPATGGEVDFSTEKSYTVTAANGDKKVYRVLVDNHAGFPVTLDSAAGDSSTAGTATTKLTLTFSAPIPTLKAEHLSLSATPALVKGGLAAVGGSVWELAVSGAAVNNLAVTVGRAGDPVGYVLSANQPATVQRTAIAFDASQVGGSNNAATTSAIQLTFGEKVAGLDAAGVVVSAPAGAALALGDTSTADGGLNYQVVVKTLSANGIVVTVTPDKTGQVFNPASKNVTVYKDTRIQWTNLEQVGGSADGSQTTTALRFTFDADLGAAPVITLTIAAGGSPSNLHTGTFTRTAAGVYELPVGGLTAHNAAQLVTITSLGAGNALNTATAQKTVNVYYQEPAGTIAAGNEAVLDLMVKFGIKSDGYAYTGITPQDVTDTFVAVHKYLAKNDPAAAASKIAVGDYIDLRSLAIQPGALGQGALNSVPASAGTLRLLVAGRNTYNGAAGNGTKNHVVFVLNESTAQHVYESAAPRKSYTESTLRTYVVQQFMAGLQNAGVPFRDDAIVFAPERWAYKVGATWDYNVVIRDKLWVPTAKELNNTSTTYYSHFEKDDWRKVTRTLEYFTKHTPAGGTRWTASPWDKVSGNPNPNNNYIVYTTGGFNMQAVNTDAAVVPAFCVK